jgi:hypothetical protein
VEGSGPGSGCFGRSRGEEVGLLATPEKIRMLQRRLYVKAKGDDTRSPGGGPATRLGLLPLEVAFSRRSFPRAPGVTPSASLSQ